MGAFYRALPPRLTAVVPMIGLQFSVYEFMKTLLLREPGSASVGAAAATTAGKGAGKGADKGVKARAGPVGTSSSKAKAKA